MTKIYTEQELEEVVTQAVGEANPQWVFDATEAKRLVGNIMSLVKAATWLKGEERELPRHKPIFYLPTEWSSEAQGTFRQGHEEGYELAQQVMLTPDSKGVSFQPCIDWAEDTLPLRESTYQRICAILDEPLVIADMARKILALGLVELDDQELPNCPYCRYSNWPLLCPLLQDNFRRVKPKEGQDG